MKPNHALALALIAVMTLATTAVLAIGPTTQPASTLGTLTIDIWTCAAHEQFRQPQKGACPVCGEDLVQKEITLQGGTTAGDPDPRGTCAVAGGPLGAMGAPVVMVHDGREVRFCCKGCIGKFEANPSEYLQKVDQKIIEQQLPYYPLTTCPVSEEDLHAMGDPVNMVYNNRLIRLCCNGCKRAFKKDPAGYVATVNAAVVEAQRDDYPLETCPISKQKLGSMGDPVDYVVANRLVRFCCGGCVAGFYKMPSGQLAALNEAWGDEDG